ncbi:hypothetical protein [Engelhardtia mirabilis]|uniref:Uncharacterized protein n=1 Tax=Engelhardtia mirabilis TaxID=2528011 RepID=A0A518BQR5_9BACT|nr:hypothetical protein Pla133_44370 [Planctomycetes bacterium Pla133]QDV03644.1 hypothetical protein Pla86_44350 [Planctomycetes bacterium Pla86]
MASLALLSSCVAGNFIQGQVNAHRLQELDAVPERVGINIWRDATLVERKSTGIPNTDENDYRTYLGVKAPAWSYGGMALRLFASVDPDNRAEVELQAASYSESGVEIQLFDESEELPSSGPWNDEQWIRFAVDEGQLDRLRNDGLVLQVRCEVGEWTFRLAPEYLEGFEAKVEDLGLLR